MLEVTAPLVPPDRVSYLEQLISSCLLSGETAVETWERELAKAVEEEMSERHLQISPEITHKVTNIKSDFLFVET